MFAVAFAPRPVSLLPGSHGNLRGMRHTPRNQGERPAFLPRPGTRGARSFHVERQTSRHPLNKPFPGKQPQRLTGSLQTDPVLLGEGLPRWHRVSACQFPLRDRLADRRRDLSVDEIFQPSHPPNVR